jgi:hypothetical protein
MKTLLSFLLLVIASGISAEYVSAQAGSDDWISLFDGETLDGWKASENPETFFIEDNMIVTYGDRSHLFYMGINGNASFTDFELSVDIKTMEGANSGIYFHTEYQETGWPNKGYEAQINNTYPNDPRRTGSLYGVDDITDQIAEDNEWFTMKVKVVGDQITITVNGNEIVNYTEPENVEREERSGRRLSSGTVALQGHDPESKVYFKNIRIREI